jgi:pyruvate/2-oxoglutarate dehydrogenase complex dihydrolipoamide acyltransferase (E2) component
VVPGRALTLILACDHRILYGAAAAAFLTQIKELVEGMNL